jgi:hypothetical protein
MVALAGFLGAEVVNMGADYQIRRAHRRLRFIADGCRALIFFGGRGSAGLTTAVWVLVAYGIFGLVVGGVGVLLIDGWLRRRNIPDPDPQGAWFLAPAESRAERA